MCWNSGECRFHYCTESFNHLSTLFGVGSNHTRTMYETSQVMPAGVPVVFSQSSAIFNQENMSVKCIPP